MKPVFPAPTRRKVLSAGIWTSLSLGCPAMARPGPLLAFPRDGGAHPDFSTEWWYVTGWANAGGQTAAYGFQLTFFRSRIPKTQGMRSGLAARQLIFAHAAITNIRGRKHWHDQRMARSSGRAPGSSPTDTAWADSTHTAITLQDWSLVEQNQVLQANLRCADFSLALTLTPTQPVLLQGDQGLSRKGPDAAQTSYYYSLPHMQVQGALELHGKQLVVEPGSTAWLDHEWSQEMLHPDAVGWDWIGINLFDGSALTAFQLRDRRGAALWDGGSFRTQTVLHTFQRGDVVFSPVRNWTSPLSQATYPVEWAVRTPSGTYTVRALLDNQELDSRASTGAIYWEGLSEVRDSQQRLVGRGYLEMTGYAAPMRM